MGDEWGRAENRVPPRGLFSMMHFATRCLESQTEKEEEEEEEEECGVSQLVSSRFNGQLVEPLESRPVLLGVPRGLWCWLSGCCLAVCVLARDGKWQC